MAIQINKLPKSEVEILVEIPKEEFNSIIGETTKKLSENLEVQGFRKGKVPKEIAESKIGEETILKEASEQAIRMKYLEAIKDLDVISEPEVEIQKVAKDNPFVFKAKVFVLPEIDLGDYKKIAGSIERKKAEVTEEEINNIKKEKEEIEKVRWGEEVLKRITDKMKVEIPQVLIQREKQVLLSEVKRNVPINLQITFEEYLKKLNKTEGELSESLIPEAEKRLKNFLAIKEIAKRENLSVSEKEINEAVERNLIRYKEKPSSLDLENLKGYYREVLKNEKVFNFLLNL